MNLWTELPKWGKWLSAVAAGVTAAGVLLAIAGQAFTYYQPAQHHNADIQMVLNEIAEQKRQERLERLREQLRQAERDYVGGRYANEEEKALIDKDIEFMKSIIRCLEAGEENC